MIKKMHTPIASEIRTYQLALSFFHSFLFFKKSKPAVRDDQTCSFPIQRMMLYHAVFSLNDRLNPGLTHDIFQFLN